MLPRDLAVVKLQRTALVAADHDLQEESSSDNKRVGSGGRYSGICPNSKSEEYGSKGLRACTQWGRGRLAGQAATQRAI
jgi:hypothetical protein